MCIRDREKAVLSAFFSIRSSGDSAASTIFMGAMARRTNEDFSKTSGDNKSSSLRVPEAARLMAGQSRSSATLRSSTISLFPVPLNS